MFLQHVKIVVKIQAFIITKTIALLGIYPGENS